MKNRIFTIFDTKANAYLAPFFLHQEGMAERTFGDCINSRDHQFGAHPEDYTLFLVGEFDDQTGKFETHAPTSLGNGVEFVVSPKPNEQMDAFDETEIGNGASIQSGT